MKRLFIILIIIMLAGCSAPPRDVPPAAPDIPPSENLPPTDDYPTENVTPVPPQNVSTPAEEAPLEVDPQLDPKLTVDAYLGFITQALDGDEDAYADAYKLISPHSTKNLHWMGTLERYKNEAIDTYAKYDNGHNVTGWVKTEEFGNGYRVYYSFDDDEVYYITQTYDGLSYIASGSKPGSMFWRFTGQK